MASPIPPPALDPIGLLASVGHDLRQPFQAMRLFLQLLQGRLSDPRQVELADRLEEALEIGAEQMDQVLTLATLAAGSARIRVEQVPLSPVLTRVTDALAEKARAAGKTIRLVDSSATVQTDPIMLDRVLRALIDNAIAHATPGHRILVGVRRVGGPCLIVADDGPGIPPADRAAMMAAGGRLDRVTSGRRGLGLGLTLCHHIAQRLDHDLTLGGTQGLSVRLRFSP